MIKYSIITFFALLLISFNGFAQENISDEEDYICILPIIRPQVYPGCDESLDNDDLKRCLYKKISQHVNANFDLNLAKQYGVEGKNRVYIRFSINEEGDVIEVKARSSHPTLSELGKNAIKGLPKMKPAIENGKATSVLYTLPFTFIIDKEEIRVEK